MKPKSPILVRTQLLLLKLIPGCFWIVYSIYAMTRPGKPISFLLTGAIFLLILFIPVLLKGEIPDEMADANYEKAMAATAKTMRRVYLLALMISMLVLGILEKNDITYWRSVPYIFFILVGIHDILVAVYFYKYEIE